MHCKYLSAIIGIATLVFATSCRSKVDLENVDARAEMELGLALPIGSMHATFGDFLGVNTFPNLCVDAEGVYHLIDTIDVPTKEYHKVDLTTYLLENKNAFDCKIQDKIDGKTSIDGDGTQVTLLEFPLTLSTSNFNTNVKNERVDSIFVSSAQFKSVIDVEQFNLEWSEIARVELELDKKQFRRADGYTVSVPLKGFNFGDSIPINVDNFTVNLMDKGGKTIENVNYTIRFYVRPDHDIAVSDASKFIYDLKVQVVEFDAIWGYFAAGNEMRDQDHLNIDSLWEGWQDFKKLKLRFMEPQADLFITHKIAAPLRMYVDTLVAKDSLGNRAFATWNGNPVTDFDLPNVLGPDTRLIDSVDNHIHLSYKPDEGHIDQLFDVKPDFFDYSYYLEVDPKPRTDYPWDQHRITKDINVNAYAIVDIPFKLNKESEVEYISLREDVSISRFSLDSLVESVQLIEDVKAADIRLIVQIDNGIPFDLDAKFFFLDKNGKELKLQLVQDSTMNHLHVGAAKMARAGSDKYGRVTEPTSERYIFRVGQNEFDRLSEVTSIKMHVAMIGNPEPCKLTKDTDLKVTMGLAAHVDALLDFNNVSNENDTK